MSEERFVPDRAGRHALFLDTSALYPYFYERAAQHEEMASFFTTLGENRLPYRPLYTNQYVVDELVTLLVTDATHATAVTAVETLRESDAISVLSVTDETFDAAVEQFVTYDDQEISLTDHSIAVQAEERDVEYLLAYDDDFETFGFTVVPRGG